VLRIGRLRLGELHLQPPPRVQASEMAILHRAGITTILTELHVEPFLAEGKDRGRATLPVALSWPCSTMNIGTGTERL
jgi:hypothetical protein